MGKKVLVGVSEHGFWVEELLMPLDRLKAAGIEVEFCTPTGRIPFADGASLDAQYKDPPLGREVTSTALAARARSANWSELFAKRVDLSGWFPLRPYLSAPQYLRDLERYYQAREEAWKRISDYDALLLVGGSGPIVDMVNNGRLHDLILGFYYADKPIAAECYTVTCLAFARELNSRKSILTGRHVTGHTIEYDYTEGWSLLVRGEYLNFGAPPFPLEYILRDAVGPTGEFHGNVGRTTSVILDYPFLTSRSVAESDTCGQILVQTLQGGLRRFGW